jgi:Fe-S oxidoreductase
MYYGSSLSMMVFGFLKKIFIVFTNTFIAPFDNMGGFTSSKLSCVSNPMNDMNLAYYPGCTLDTSAKEINESLRQVCNRLSIHLRKLPDWNCCGSSSVHAVRTQLAVSLAARNLFQAQTFDSDLMVMCAGCMNRLRVAEYHLRQSPTTIRVNEEIFGNRLNKL